MSIQKAKLTVIEKYMAQSLHFALHGPSTNLPTWVSALSILTR